METGKLVQCKSSESLALGVDGKQANYLITIVLSHSRNISDFLRFPATLATNFSGVSTRQ